ncbi:PilX N-terminal domain-containing pilus assembly protein [Uliginosibacterium sp. H3]|uniref:PilX N-terminal domain-containing pilus assembly protein n=1 Tax=Uliginosibacterium silvisoli TaxID=3114758 RepID=A0ABU6JXI7_9RHOO|nr:PilX N-terminal domain-containing pilus assembly protein [Uliginosibacterium sp. H3]
MDVLVRRQRQQGAALLVALVMLILVSLLAAAGYTMATGEARGAAGWSDRQRAMFMAEGALKEAEDKTRALVAASPDVEAAVRTKRSASAGYYVRKDGDMPALDPWPTTGIEAASNAESRSDAPSYIIVFEGKAIGSNDGMLSNGRVNQAAGKPRFTLYAKAGGIKEGSYVVLSTAKEF